MGRAVNSFTSWVGHAEETIDEERVTLPEKDLWIAVLCRAVLGACKGPPSLNMKVPANVTHRNLYNFNHEQARHFFLEGGPHFRHICEMAGRNPAYVQARIRKILLRKYVWNVDVSMSVPSTYRKRKKQKGLTGNSYYAARRKEETPN